MASFYDRIIGKVPNDFLPKYEIFKLEPDDDESSIKMKENWLKLMEKMRRKENDGIFTSRSLNDFSFAQESSKSPGMHFQVKSKPENEETNNIDSFKTIERSYHIYYCISKKFELIQRNLQIRHPNLLRIEEFFIDTLPENSDSAFTFIQESSPGKYFQTESEPKPTFNFVFAWLKQDFLGWLQNDKVNNIAPVFARSKVNFPQKTVRTFESVRQILIGILEGISVAHSCNLGAMNITFQDILIKEEITEENELMEPEFVPKLSIFPTGRSILDNETPHPPEMTFLDMKDLNMSKKWSPKVDIYRFGLLLYCLFVSDCESIQISKITKNNIKIRIEEFFGTTESEIPEVLIEELEIALKNTLETNPEDRKYAQQLLLENSFFSNKEDFGLPKQSPQQRKEKENIKNQFSFFKINPSVDNEKLKDNKMRLTDFLREMQSAGLLTGKTLNDYELLTSTTTTCGTIFHKAIDTQAQSSIRFGRNWFRAIKRKKISLGNALYFDSKLVSKAFQLEKVFFDRESPETEKNDEIFVNFVFYWQEDDLWSLITNKKQGKPKRFKKIKSILEDCIETSKDLKEFPPVLDFHDFVWKDKDDEECALATTAFHDSQSISNKLENCFEFFAPEIAEMIEKSNFDAKKAFCEESAVYSFGVILFKIFVDDRAIGKNRVDKSWINFQNLKTRISTFDSSRISAVLIQSLEKLILDCLEDDPQNRPNFGFEDSMFFNDDLLREMKFKEVTNDVQFEELEVSIGGDMIKKEKLHSFLKKLENSNLLLPFNHKLDTSPLGQDTIQTNNERTEIFILKNGKILKKKRIDLSSDLDFKTEIEILSRIKNDNIISLDRVFFSRDLSSGQFFINLMMPFISQPFLSAIGSSSLSGGDSDYHCIDSISSNFLQIRDSLVEILTGIDNLHENGIVHMDLSFDNLRRNARFHNTEKIEQKIIIVGFGNSREETDLETPFANNISDFSAPEIVESKTNSFSTKSDMFSFGMILYYIFVGGTELNRTMITVPNIKKRIEVVFSGNQNKKSEYLGEFVRNLTKVIANLVSVDPQLRFSAKQILNDFLFFNKQREAQIEERKKSILSQFDMFGQTPNDSTSVKKNKLMILGFLKKLKDKGKLGAEKFSEYKSVAWFPGGQGIVHKMVPPAAPNFTDIPTEAKPDFVALKRMKFSLREKISFKKEIEFMNLLENPHLIRIEKIFFDKEEQSDNINIVMPWIKYTFMSWLIKSEGEKVAISTEETHAPKFFDIPKNQRSFEEVRRMLIGALHGLECLHGNRIIHLDIKFDNMLIDERIGKDGELIHTCIISDLGSSKGLNQEFTSTPISYTPQFVAPEVSLFLKSQTNDPDSDVPSNEGEHLTKHADMYSFGVILYKLFVHEMWDIDQKFVTKELIQDRVTQIFTEFSASIPVIIFAELEEIIKNLLDPIPTNRLFVDALLEKYSYFQE